MDKNDIAKLEELGYVADSKQVREELVSTMHNTKESLEAVQKILKEIQKTAKKKGLFTRQELSKSSLTLKEAIEIAHKKRIITSYHNLSDKLLPKHTEKRIKI